LPELLGAGGSFVDEPDSNCYGRCQSIMPYRKTKLESPPALPDSTAEKQSPLSRPSPAPNLDSLIRDLEDDFLKITKNKDGKSSVSAARRFLSKLRHAAESFDSWCWSPRRRPMIEQMVGDLPNEPTPPEVLADRLLILWADADFWRIIRKVLKEAPDPPATIDHVPLDYLRDKYDLYLQIPVNTWLEMVRKPIQRAYCFELMTVFAWRYFPVQSSVPKQNLPARWRTELSRDKLGAMLDMLCRYVQYPARDWRPQLVLTGFPKETLERLRAAVNRFADDIGYVLKNPTRFDAGRAPPIGHRVRTLADAHHIEQMVAMLRQQPEITDYSLAKQCLGSMAGSSRKLAKEARLLASYRDGLHVKFYASRGSKNMPKTPA
jgi:hypothetical protein